METLPRLVRMRSTRIGWEWTQPWCAATRGRPALAPAELRTGATPPGPLEVVPAPARSRARTVVANRGPAAWLRDGTTRRASARCRPGNGGTRCCHRRRGHTAGSSRSSAFGSGSSRRPIDAMSISSPWPSAHRCSRSSPPSCAGPDAREADGAPPALDRTPAVGRPRPPGAASEPCSPGLQPGSVSATSATPANREDAHLTRRARGSSVPFTKQLVASRGEPPNHRRDASSL